MIKISKEMIIGDILNEAPDMGAVPVSYTHLFRSASDE